MILSMYLMFIFTCADGIHSYVMVSIRSMFKYNTCSFFAAWTDLAKIGKRTHRGVGE